MTQRLTAGQSDPRTRDGDGQGWLGVPSTPTAHVVRSRLLALMDLGKGCPLVSVSAPAGSGKTCLVAHWVSTRAEDRTAWVTFEESETEFWRGFVDCLTALGVPVSAPVLPSGSDPLDRGVRRRIASTLAAETAPVTVVVDGYEVSSAVVATDLDFLLKHSGHRLRLILLTRADPVLPLYRYRLQEAVAEVRMADLAFTDDEAQELMAGMGVPLSPESVHALNVRTQGWVTGLRFAGKFLIDRDEPEAALDEVTGYTGNIAEYLVGEVLAAHPPALRHVLMATSIPDVIRPGLAEVLAGRSAPRSLAFLARVNAFIEQVPGRFGFYRYHPFFRELLRAELAYSAPETMVKLQLRTAEWFAAEGMLLPAVHHFALAGAWQEAAHQVVDSFAVGQLLLADQSDALVQNLKGIPDDLDDPAACVLRATLALGERDVERFDELLAGLHPSDDASSSTKGSVALAVSVLQALRAQFDTDLGQAADLAVTAEQVLSEPMIRRRVEAHPELAALVLASKGIATIRRGCLDEAKTAFEAGLTASLEAGAKPLMVECLGYLAMLAGCAGEIAHAHALAVRALAEAEEAGIQPAERSAAAHVALAWVAVERYDLRVAGEQARLAEGCDFILGDPVPRCMLVLVKSRLRAAHGDKAGALAQIEAAAEELPDRQHWLIDRLRVEAGWLKVASGEPEAALVEMADVEHGHAEAEAALVAVQAHLQLDDMPLAGAALARVIDRRSPAPIRVAGWLVESGRHLRGGSPTQAEQALQKALRLAVGARLRRPFHEAPIAVRQLMLQDRHLTSEHAWLFDVAGMTPPAIVRQGSALAERNSVSDRVSPSQPVSASPPVEPLTEKELEVLGHLAAMLTTEEIATAMYVSVNTVRTHVRNILRKLGVNRRNTAVRMARDLDLLTG